jgi:5'-3' exonuclease
LIQEGATHLAVATDQVIESFRNEIWADYKTGEGIEPDLRAQFPLLEEALSALGIVTWPMVEFEADDALASGAKTAAENSRVKQVIICTPDKDLSQCVVGDRVVQLDRRKRVTRDEAGILGKFGVLPPSIPDYLALVGDTADGYPGLTGWGAKSAASVLRKYNYLEDIPADWRTWQCDVTSPHALSLTLREDWNRALLFKDLATLRTDIRLFSSVDELRWTGATGAFPALAERLDGAILKEGSSVGKRLRPLKK